MDVRYGHGMAVYFAEDDRVHALKKLRDATGVERTYECSLCAVAGTRLAFSVLEDWQDHSIEQHGIQGAPA